MPIFEYRCSDCDNKFEVLHRSSTNQKEVSCPECQSANVSKLLSAFSANVPAGSSASAGSCATGNCDIPSAPPVGGCASGMCGLN